VSTLPVLHSTPTLVVVVLLTGGAKKLREDPTSDHAPRSGPDIKNGRNSAKAGVPKRLRCETIQKEVS